MRGIRPGALAVILFLGAGSASAQDSRMLGPRDGADLPPVDTGRVKIGDIAPDFALRSLAGPTIVLTDYRGTKNIILVFYRGYW